MKKVLIIVLAAVMVAAVFVGGYAIGKAERQTPIAWADSTGETYFAK